MLLASWFSFWWTTLVTDLTADLIIGLAIDSIVLIAWKIAISLLV